MIEELLWEVQDALTLIDFWTNHIEDHVDKARVKMAEQLLRLAYALTLIDNAR
jgi:hypothetical protein